LQMLCTVFFFIVCKLCTIYRYLPYIRHYTMMVEIGAVRKKNLR